MSESVEDGNGLFEAAKGMNLEGIMAKEKTSKYYPGRRSDSWIKVKVRNTVDCIILGFTEGKGDRKPYFGALHIGQEEEGRLIYRGKVGSGFTDKSMKSISKVLNEINSVPRYIEEIPIDDKVTTWIEPRLVCELEYASITSNATFREPVFARLRPDLEPNL